MPCGSCGPPPCCRQPPQCECPKCPECPSCYCGPPMCPVICPCPVVIHEIKLLIPQPAKPLNPCPWTPCCCCSSCPSPCPPKCGGC